jgi:cephalosporin-C deacetylase-like acetyl esterase
MVRAPWYIRNNDLHRDLQVDVVSSEIQMFALKHEGRLHHHENVETIQLLDNTCIVRRIRRKKTFWVSLSDSVNAETVTVLVC